MAEFSNPNQQGGQDSKSLLAMMVIVVAIFFGAQVYHSKMAPQPAAPAVSTTQTIQSSSAPAYVPPVATASAAPATASVPAAPVVEASAESTTVVENELYRITFSNRGAQVVSWVLKQATDDQGKPLDLVAPEAAKVFGYPLSLYTYDGATMQISGVSRHAGIVTLAINGALPVGINGRAVAIAGVADNTYDGTYIVTQTGPSTLTYTTGYGDNNSSSGGSLSTVNGGIAETLNRAMFVPSATGSLSTPATLTFHYSDGTLRATKSFTFDASYVLHAHISVIRNGAPERALLSWPGGFGDQNETPSGRAYGDAQFDSDSQGGDQHLAPKKISGGATLNGPFDWAGVSDPFFLSVFLPDSPATATVATLEGQFDVSKTLKRSGFGSGSAPTKATPMPILGAALGDVNGATDTRIFVGPKAIDVLKGVHASDSRVTLEPMLSFGFWGPIGKYLFVSLHLIHDHIVAHWRGGAWGWAIIVLTVLINILILPFRIKTMQSALKMQRIQPQMDAIKEKYKKYKVTDPKKNDMNAEIMQLQKDNGVNMFGGCIPTLITMPLLFAFFTMIPKVVELRHSHWLWLPDLQQQDPYYILPILMVVSQFLVQFYTPSPGVDPQQQKMMAFMMPAFSGFMTMHYASGLALYWSVGNFISIVQQKVMNRTSLGREMRQIAAKRARRKAGTGVTVQGRR
ncbi:MAG TPA: YidC/Oxa1 family insertase periplasmic-domain containing protein [Acidobacteriaceae bacterium]|nr:YidC/Oxa1 family insertase periplasmic-domain containing protein [Acidobacteriaceae bacterium]